MPVLIIQTDRDAEQFVRGLSRRFRSAVLALLATVIVSTLGFVYLSTDASSPGKRIFDGLWRTLNLVSTVGSLSPPLTDAQRAWSIIVIAVIDESGAQPFNPGHDRKLDVGDTSSSSAARAASIGCAS